MYPFILFKLHGQIEDTDPPPKQRYTVTLQCTVVYCYDVYCCAISGYKTVCVTSLSGTFLYLTETRSSIKSFLRVS